jgi:phenylacetate-CoA ligase
MKKRFDREQFYQGLPVALQNIAVSFEGWRLKKRRYGKAYRNAFDRILNQEKFSKQELIRFQRDRLCDFMKAASRSVFWQNRFSKYRVDLNADDIFGEIARLPILTKDEVKANVSDIPVQDASNDTQVSVHTSGTTGSGLIFKTTQKAEREQWATWWRYRQWHGVDQNTWCGYFGGRSLVSLSQNKPPFWRVNRPGKQLMFSAYHLKSETAKEYVKALCRYGVVWLHGYPSTLSLLAGFIIENKLPATPSIRVVTTGAESLLPQQKKIISSAFGAPVFQHYGQAEAVANISECEQGNLHVDEDFSFVEFVPLESEGNLYKIVGTNWTNTAFPLIRYETGDIASISSELCSCGRSGRIVKDIDGRKEDFIQLPSGAMIGRLDHIFKDLVHIREAQIYQIDPSSVTFRIVKGHEYDESGTEKLLYNEAVRRLGTEIKILFEYVQSIDKTPSGKLRFVISDLKK